MAADTPAAPAAARRRGSLHRRPPRQGATEGRQRPRGRAYRALADERDGLARRQVSRPRKRAPRGQRGRQGRCGRAQCRRRQGRCGRAQCRCRRGLSGARFGGRYAPRQQCAGRRNRGCRCGRQVGRGHGWAPPQGRARRALVGVGDSLARRRVSRPSKRAPQGKRGLARRRASRPSKRAPRGKRGRRGWCALSPDRPC